jgi:mRNA-degrading endonuclease HigB of HigAB toxin-antitoxin module
MNNDFLVSTKKGILLNKSDIDTLKKYDIDCNEYASINEILYKINDILTNEELEDTEYDELDYIATTLQEQNYYQNTNK